MDSEGAPELSTHDRLRRELGARMRALRHRSGLSGPQLAEFVNLGQSEISRFETGRIVPKPEHVALITATLGASREEQAELVELASELGVELNTWRLLHRAGISRDQEDRARLEKQAKEIRIYHWSVIPGLIQTPEYARAILALVTGKRPETLDDAVEARMRRQEILYDTNKRFFFLINESVLRNGLARPEVMAEQTDRLLTVSALRQVTLSVIPEGEPLSALMSNGFVMLDDRMVVTETLTAELTLTSSRDVSAYRAAFEKLEAAAVRGADMRQLLVRMA